MEGRVEGCGYRRWKVTGGEEVVECGKEGCVLEEDSIGWNGADVGIRRKNRGRRAKEGGDRKK